MVTLGVSDLEESVRFYEQVRDWCPLFWVGPKDEEA